MIALDANILVYAHRTESPLHGPARELVAALAAGPAEWAIPWPCLHEFYAMVTNTRIQRTPSPPGVAWSQINAWTESPRLRLLGETHAHLDHLRQLTIDGAVAGGLVHDARVAAICLGHGVSELITMDRDFSRFPALRTRSLLA